MCSLVNSNYNRTYNPSGRQNALSDIKRLLTSRDTSAQNKACGYLIEVINRYNRNSNEGAKSMVEYLLDNDITVFLCEATTNLDFSLFKSVTACLRLVWRSPRFFSSSQGAHAASCVVHALAHYAHCGHACAVTHCLRFLWDLLNGISANNARPVLSHQSPYSTEQVLASLLALAGQAHLLAVSTVLAAGMLLEALIGYQPDGLYISSSTAQALVPVLSAWVSVVVGALQHAALAGPAPGPRGGDLGPFYLVACLICIHSLSLIKLFKPGAKKVDLVQTILADDQDTNVLKQCSVELATTVQRVIEELVAFTKEYQSEIPTEEYGVFLQLLLTFFQEGEKDVKLELCESLFARGYLAMLPQAQLARNDLAVRKVSTLVLAELLKLLAGKYLAAGQAESTCAHDIHLGLVELQNGIVEPHSVGTQLQRGQPYTMLVYIYFYCQSADNPEEATSPLLPFLVEHILKMPDSFRPPPYVIKALWLVFGMSRISGQSAWSLEERVRVERASARLVCLLQPEPARYYTHHPALLLWAFSSHRIHHYLKYTVVSEWLKLENAIPAELTTEPSVRELLVHVLIHSGDRRVLEHCMETLQLCLEEDDDARHLSELVWSVLPDVLSKALIDDEQLAPNVGHLVELATCLPPRTLQPPQCQQTAPLLTAVFSRSSSQPDTSSKHHFQYVCMKLCLHLLELANKQNDHAVVVTCVSRACFLPAVLAACWAREPRSACAALQLLSYLVHHCTRRHYQPSTVLQLQLSQVIPSLRSEWHNERGASLLQLIYIVLNAGATSPLALCHGGPPAHHPGEPAHHPGEPAHHPGTALRALMFRVQQMLCTRSGPSPKQSSAGWKTLSATLKHALLTNKDSKIVATLTTQPWTFILVQFHISQPSTITTEFLTFLQNWLTLLKIAVENEQEGKKLSEYSLVSRTMVMLRRKLKAEEGQGQQDLVHTVHSIAREILHGGGLRGQY